jgi:hypothetical protein
MTLCSLSPKNEGFELPDDKKKTENEISRKSHSKTIGYISIVK